MTTTKRFIGNDTGDDSITDYLDSIRAGVFGALLRLGMLADHGPSLVTSYHGDFYYDAFWIEKHVSGPTVFFFGADESGTAIGDDAGYVAMSRDNVWRVDLTRDDKRRWHVELSKLTADEMLAATNKTREEAARS